MHTRWKIGLGAAAALVVAIQLVPVERSNPPIEQELAVPDDVRAVLRESCYDCHSNETRWPWYAYVAPVSWIVTDHVNHARSHLNFSTWNAYDAEERAELIHEIWEEVDEGKMPLPSYLRLHGDARLTDEDRRTLQAWTDGHDGNDGNDGPEGDRTPAER